MENNEVQKVKSDEEKANAASLASFNKMKATIDAQVKNLESIKIIDETSFAVASQQLSSAKQLNKQIDDAHKKTKEEALKFCQAVDKAKKDLKSPLEKAMDKAEKEVLSYDVKIKAEKTAALAKLEVKQEAVVAHQVQIGESLKNEMVEFEKRAFQRIDECKTEADLSGVYQQYIMAFPSNYDVVIKGRISNLGKAKIDLIRGVTTQDAYEKIKVDLSAVVPEMKAPEVILPQFDVIESEKAVIMSSGPTNIKRKWVFEVENENEVPRMFLMVDEKAVKEWMKKAEEVGNLKDGQVHQMNGFKFYQESSVKIK
jgi:hypothetical protein